MKTNKKNIYNEESNNFTTYLEQINKIKVIKYEKEEEWSILKQIKNGDLKLREKFINNYLQYVIQIAKNYQQKNEFLMDLIMEGNVGLIKSVEKVDVKKLEEKNMCFMTYSQFWIKQSILIYLYNNNGMFKLNPQLTNELRRMKKNVEKLEQKLQRTPTIEEIIESVQINSESLRGKRLMKLFYSNTTNTDILNNKFTIQIDLDNLNELKYKMNNLLAQITYREAEVIKMSFGIDEDEMTTKEISEKLNMSCDRVRSVKKSGIERLKTIMSEKRLYL